MTIHLTECECLFATIVGNRRQAEATRRNLPDRHGFKGDPWDIHVQGAAGELAFAKATGRYWDGTVNTFKRGGDVGEIQVRTRSRHDYELLVREDDRDNDVFVLVTGRIPTFRVHGWIRGADGKRDEWKQTHGGREAAWFVPHSALQPLQRRAA